MQDTLLFEQSEISSTLKLSFFFFADRFFKIIKRLQRGFPIAALKSPSLRGQRCVVFKIFFQGSSAEQFNVYKSAAGKRTLMFQRGAEYDGLWRFHQVTIVPSSCETYQVRKEMFCVHRFGKPTSL